MRSHSSTFTFGDPRLPPPFWAKVRISLTGCWLWTASLTSCEYGQVSWRGHIHKAHRLAYETLVGKVPNHLELDHLCRVRHCVYPAHLEPVTHLVNVRRGFQPSSLKTHCLRGHLYTPQNTAKRESGQRACLACKRERQHRTRHLWPSTINRQP